MRLRLLMLICGLSLAAGAQTSPCGAPIPGSPHVCITWTASTTPGVTYNVYRASSAGGENYATPLNSSPLAVLFFHDVTVAIGSTYYYTAVAVGTGGVLSAPSPEVSAQVPVPPNSPTAPAASID
jgi:fibronectin type 3 domain-containing protein